MAIVASLDLTSYLQVISPPSWIGQARYTDNRCSMVHSRSSVDLLRSVPPVIELTPSTRDEVLPQVRVDDKDFRSRDSAKSAATSDSSGCSTALTKETIPASPSLSSLSSASWPKSTRKRVWFADDVGLDLVTVRRYDLPAPSPPVAESVPARRSPCRRRLRLEPGFRQPWLDPAGLRCRLDRNAVVLESVSSRGSGLPFAGTVLVSNMVFEKRVTVRCTFDFWHSYVDVAAVYVTTGCSDTDLFSFEVQYDVTASPDRPCPRRHSGRFQFAIRYQYREHGEAIWTERWDNNDGRNYTMLAAY